MKMCQDHWEQLRTAIDRRGFSPSTYEELVEGSEDTPIDFLDPLMGAYVLVMETTLEEIKDRYDQNPLMIMADPSEHPEWACPVCALNWCHAEHLRLCNQAGCDYPKDWDWVQIIDAAADVTTNTWKAMENEQ